MIYNIYIYDINIHSWRLYWHVWFLKSGFSAWCQEKCSEINKKDRFQPLHVVRCCANQIRDWKWSRRRDERGAAWTAKFAMPFTSSRSFQVLCSGLLKFYLHTPKHVPIWLITQINTSQCIQSVGRIEKHLSEIPLDNIQNLSKSKNCFCSRPTAWFTPTCSKRMNVHTSMLSDDPMELQNQIYSIDKTRR